MDEQQLAVIAAEDAAPDDQLSPKARKRKEARLKKRAARAREKQQKVAQAEAEKAEQFDDIQQFWDFNRARLTEEQRTTMEVRQLGAWDLTECMQAYIDGSDGTTEQDLKDTIQEVVSDVAAHGLCNSSVLAIDRVWTEECADLRSHFSKPTLDLVTYGFYTAVTERAFEDFRNKFLTPRSPITSGGEMAICSFCHSLDTSRWVSESAKGQPFVCHRCIDAENKSRAQASIPSTLHASRMKERNAMFDSWGRLRDQ